MGRKFRVRVGEKTFDVEVEEILETAPSVSVRQPPVVREVIPKIQGQADETIRKPERVEEGKSGMIKAPLPGKVVALKCKEGDGVKAGEAVLILESMKMENEIVAPKSGTVRKIFVTEQSSVSDGDVLLEIE